MKHLLLTLLLISPLSGFAQESNATTILLIRHAQTTSVTLDERTLSKEGVATAERWVSVLDAEDIETIYSTDYKRTQATAAPIALAKGGLSVISYDPDNFDLEKVLADAKGKTILIVGHSGTTPDNVNLLIGENKFPPIEADNHGNLYIVNYFSKNQVNANLINAN